MRRFLVTLLAAGWCASPGEAAETDGGDSPASASVRFYQRYISDLRYGRCYFEPSCSHYALSAVDRHGMLLGSALAADRLIRCHPGAHRHYGRDATGRLSDPVGGAPGPVRLRVPDWLLPPPLDDPFPHTGTEGEGERDGRLPEYAAYGEQLASQGDCWRAETEYGRAAFLAGTEEARAWAKRRTAACSFGVRDWDAAAGGYLEAADLAPDDVLRRRMTFWAAASLFNAGDYEGSSGVARGQGGPEGEGAAFLLGLSALAEGRWDEASARFADIAERPGSPNRDRAVFLRWKAEEGTDVPRRRPTLAAVFSAVIPGSGQMYSGRIQDGLRHLFVNGVLIWSVYRLFDSQYYAGGYLLAGFTLPFYVGNVVGAKRSAEQFNASERTAYVARVVDEAAHQ